MTWASFSSARAALDQAAEALLQIPDQVLGEARWRSGENERPIRSGLYDIYERLQGAAAGMVPPAPTPASSSAHLFTASRWALQGLLRTLGDDDLDRDPGLGQWDVRTTVSHLITAQAGWAWLSGHWLRLVEAGEPVPIRVDRSEYPAGLRAEAPNRAGTMPELRRQFDDQADDAIENLAALSKREVLESRILWGPFGERTVGYMPQRWTAHAREHTIQIEKILDLLGRRPTEIDRLVRLVLESYGELEGRCLLSGEGDSKLGGVISEVQSLTLELCGAAGV